MSEALGFSCQDSPSTPLQPRTRLCRGEAHRVQNGRKMTFPVPTACLLPLVCCLLAAYCLLTVACLLLGLQARPHFVRKLFSRSCCVTSPSPPLAFLALPQGVCLWRSSLMSLWPENGEVFSVYMPPIGGTKTPKRQKIALLSKILPSLKPQQNMERINTFRLF